MNRKFKRLDQFRTKHNKCNECSVCGIELKQGGFLIRCGEGLFGLKYMCEKCVKEHFNYKEDENEKS